MITVVNKYKEPNHIYCGRGSPLGNPFRMRHESERAEVCAKHRKWFIKQVNEVKPPAMMQELNRIIKLAAITDINLGCFCAPKQCHCDIIKEYIEFRLTSIKPE